MAAVVETFIATLLVGLAFGVTLEGVNVQLDLSGRPEQVNEMAALNPFGVLIVKFSDLDWPAVTVISVSAAWNVKSCTVNAMPLLAMPVTVTTTLPDVAPAGTLVAIEVSLQVVTVAVCPLKVTVLVPCVVEPKLVPVIVTPVPTGAEVRLRLVMAGGGTVKLTPLDATPLTVTTTTPVVAPFGTGTTIEVALQVVGAAVFPLNVTVLVPCVVSKFVPVIVTGKPAEPEVRFRLVM